MDDPGTRDTTIVTGSDRLARHLLSAHATRQAAAGRLAWEQPDILPVGAFWRRLLDALVQDPELPLAARRLLPRAAMQCRWESLVAAHFVDKPLLRTDGAARSALEAWQLCRDWQLDIDALGNDPLEETRLLVEWGRNFERECVAQQWLPDYAVPEAVLAALEQSVDARRLLPARIELKGFMELSPRETRLWHSLHTLGVKVEQAGATDSRGRAGLQPCIDAEAEHRAAAAWVRERLLRDPAQRIAIIVPALAERRAPLRHALLEALAPAGLIHPDEPAPFNMSLGLALAERALVADALALLSLANERVEFATAARLCRSPYLGADHAARLALEAVLRRDGFAEFSVNDLAWLGERNGASVLAESIKNFREAVRTSADALPSQWARRFSEWLALFHWARTRPLDSEEFQARRAFDELLGRLGELDPVLGQCTHMAALSWLKRLAVETPFQPRAHAAPVQVLGLLEATGMHFDAAWIMGLTDDVLPAAPRPNPFLPIDVQRASGMPQSSAAREQAFARTVFDGLMQAAPHIVFSWPQHERDAELRASPLLHGIPVSDVARADSPRLARRLFDSARTETFDDRQGPALHDANVRGGTALLQNQSHCGFRAFAIHRLHAGDWPTPTAGPDARARGLIVHRVMELLWKQWRNRAVLAHLVEDRALDAVLRETITRVVSDAVRVERHRWTRSIETLEVERLVNVLRRWFEQVELARPDFSVVEIEGATADGATHETTVQAGPLRLRGKLDRVDRLNDGSELVIDYKTGAAPTRTAFFGDRPVAPQLPAYVLARRQAGKSTPAGIAVASLRTGAESLQGIATASLAAQENGLQDVAKSQAAGDWEEAVELWEQSIAALGEAFARGDAAVDPLPGACEYCHLALACRISEQREFAEEENDG